MTQGDILRADAEPEFERLDFQVQESLYITRSDWFQENSCYVCGKATFFEKKMDFMPNSLSSLCGYMLNSNESCNYAASGRIVQSQVSFPSST